MEDKMAAGAFGRARNSGSDGPLPFLPSIFLFFVQTKQHAKSNSVVFIFISAKITKANRYGKRSHYVLDHSLSLSKLQVLKYFCESCDEAICRDCAIYEHREHIYVDLKEAVKKYRSSFTALLDKTKRKIPGIRSAVEEVMEVRESLVQRVDFVRNNIRTTIQNHIRELEEQEKELIDRLDSVYRGKEKVR